MARSIRPISSPRLRAYSTTPDELRSRAVSKAAGRAPCSLYMHCAIRSPTLSCLVLWGWYSPARDVCSFVRPIDCWWDRCLADQVLSLGYKSDSGLVRQPVNQGVKVGMIEPLVLQSSPIPSETNSDIQLVKQARTVEKFLGNC